jgi:hypothetical protein
MYQTIDQPSAPKGMKENKEALAIWVKELSTGKFNFERIIFESGDFKTISEALNKAISKFIPESTPVKIDTFLVGALNSYQTGLVREERFHLVAEKAPKLEAEHKKLSGSF